MKNALAIDLTSVAAGVDLPPPDHEFWKGKLSVPQGLETRPEQMALKLAILETRIAKLEREKWPMKIKALWQTLRNWQQRRKALKPHKPF